MFGKYCLFINGLDFKNNYFTILEIKVSSQSEYHPLICTPTCLLIGLGVLKELIEIPSALHDTDTVCQLQRAVKLSMKHGTDIYKKVSRKTGYHILSIDDIFQCFGNPDCFELLPLGGQMSSSFSSDCPYYINFHQLLMKIPDQTVCLFTTNAHTTLFVNYDNNYCWFDPLQGVFLRFLDKEQMIKYFDVNDDNTCFDATIMKRKY